MNIPLSRLIEGIIATMRSDVIPHVGDAYARGQAVGVIDLLNNIAPRVEWAQAPLASAVSQKADLLRNVAGVIPETAVDAVGNDATTAEVLLARKAELDAALGDVLAQAWPRRHEEESGRAIAAIKAHLHAEADAELKKTRKPLFAEIAGGKDGAKHD
ncbi:hypothetical protein MPL1032_240256 [Mesorhizobium plurifarium]|uniref:Uncharacterized protein n=1 Tax=Mesorhizobium plurifarium TaxID=69974 RepID=A0A0K2W1D6_MESPL|nr:hypothetical protein MPL1032_240256 [Mesorhizobium plurifarium]